MNFTPEQFVSGINAVLEALKNRPDKCYELFLAHGRTLNQSLEKIIDLATKHNINIKYVNKAFLDKYSLKHQGVAAIFEEYAYLDFDDLLASLSNKSELILLLDRVEDPRNLGALLRSAAVFGAKAIIIPKDRAAGLTPSALKSAAGAAELVPVCKVVNLVRTVEELKVRGFWLVGAEAKSENQLGTFDFPEKTLLALGSEGKGLSNLIKKQSDFLVEIPQSPVAISSLNVSVAGALFMYEYARKFLFTENYLK